MKSNYTSGFKYFLVSTLTSLGVVAAHAGETGGNSITHSAGWVSGGIGAAAHSAAEPIAKFEKKASNAESAAPKEAGEYKGAPPRTAEEYLNSLPRTEGTVTRKTGRYAPPADGCNDFHQLTFAGLQFLGDATCVAAENDTEASNACEGSRFVNPNNPQYGINQEALSTRNRTHNPKGYYYCIADDTRNSKQVMCESIAQLRYPSLQFNFVATGDRDGNCTCSGTGEPTTNDLCNDAQQIAARAQEITAPAACSGNPNVEQGQPIAAAQIPGRTPATYSDGMYCRCSQSAPQALRGTFVKVPIQENSCGAGATAQTTAASANSEFNRCLTDYRNRAMTCDRQSREARNTCREKIQKAQNSPLNIAGSMVGALGQVGMAANAGSGNQQNCFGAGVGMMGVREALRLGRESCEAEYGACEQSCAEEVYDRMLTECPSKLRDPSTGEPMTQAQLIQNNDENAQTFERTRSELQSMFTEGRRICTQDAGGASQDMNRLMSGLGNSIQQSMQCACNLSSQSNASANCNQIPNIQSCESNPNLPNCQIYSGVDTCNPASIGYNQQMCNCVQNPTACTTVSGTPPPSLFGGNLNNAPAGSGPNGFAGNLTGGGGGGGRGSYDLGGEPGGEAQVALAGPQFSGGARGGGGMGFGGGGGGGGAAGGPAGEPVFKGEVQEKGGLAGLFNQAKTALRGALGLGGGKAGTTTTANKKPTRKEDLTKFKPRNLASAGRNGIGTANMDIFGMIKMCAQGETCETNRPKSAWILTP